MPEALQLHTIPEVPQATALFHISAVQEQKVTKSSCKAEVPGQTVGKGKDC